MRLQSFEDETAVLDKHVEGSVESQRQARALKAGLDPARSQKLGPEEEVGVCGRRRSSRSGGGEERRTCGGGGEGGKGGEVGGGRVEGSGRVCVRMLEWWWMGRWRRSVRGGG